MRDTYSRVADRLQSKTGRGGNTIVNISTGGGGSGDYLPLDGSVAMLGNLDMDDNNIVNVGTFNGYDADNLVANSHARLHSITSASDHSITAAAMGIVGATSTDTLGILTPSSAPGAASAILKSDSSGFLTLPKFVATTKVTTPLIDTASGNLALDPAGGTVSIDGNAIATETVQGATVIGTTKLRAPLIDTASGDLSIVPAGGDVNVTGNLSTSVSVITPRVTTATGDLTLAASDDIMLDPASNLVKITSGVSLQSDNYVSQVTGWRATYDGQADFRYLFVDEMHAKSFIADLEQALAGGQIIAKSVAVLYSDFTAPAAGGTASLVVRDLPSATGMAVFVNGDYIRIREFSRSGGSLDISDCWGTVVLDTTYGTSGFDSSTKTQRYTFTRSTAPNAGAMSASNVVEADAIILDYGTSGNGYYEVNAIDGAYGANSPYAQIVTWSGHPRTQTVRARLGNLYGIWSTSGEYGLYAGDGVTDDDSYLRISSDTVRLNNVPLQLYSSGTQKVNIDSTGTDVWIGTNSSDKRLYWNGTTLAIEGNIVITGGSGIASLTDAGALAVADDLDDVEDGSSYHRTTPNQVTGAGRAYTAIDSGNNLVTSVIPASAITPSGAGLYLGSNYMGYYDSSVWKTYIDSSGNFKMAGSSGTNYLQWAAASNKLQGVGGGTEQWYADATDGKLYAGAGNVWMDASGINLLVELADTSPSYLNFRNSADDIVGAVGYFDTAGPTPASTDGMIFYAESGHKFRFLNANSVEFNQTVNVAGALTTTSTITSGGALSVTGDITVTGTVDGVDIASFKSAYDSHNHNASYLQLSGGTLTGTLTARAITFSADNTYDIGAADKRVQDLYVVNLHTDTIVGTPDYDHSHDYVPLDGGTMTDQLTMSFDNHQMIVLDRTTNGNVDSTFYVGVSYLTGVSDDFAFFGKSDGLQVRNDGTLYADGNLIWHAGNDGTGSGLDADTLDGSHASAFSLTSHNHDASYVPLVRTVTGSNGLTGGGALSSNQVISHADTSSQASVNNSGATFIQDVTLDDYGHVTGLVSADVSTALDALYVNVSGDTMTGDFIVKNGSTTVFDVDVSAALTTVSGDLDVTEDVTVDGNVNVGGKYLINGTQVLYYPGSPHTGTVFFGNGGGSLTYTSGTDGWYNTAVGIGVMTANTTGSYNTAIGGNALSVNTTGKQNNAIGSQALRYNTTGEYNNAQGYGALLNNINGSYNVAVGGSSQRNLQTGSYNVAIGNNALFRNVSGSSNVGIGNDAGYYEEGSNKLYIANSSTTTPLIYGDFSTSELTINGDLEVTETLTVSDNLDAMTILGRAKIGYAATADSATFAHYDYNTSTNFALAQYNTGATVLNAPTGQTIGLAINAVDTLTVSANYVNPRGNMQVSAGDYNRKFSQVHAFEFIVDNLVASNVMATIGGRVLVSDTIYLSSDMDAGSNYPQSDYASLNAGDFGYMAALIDGSPQVEIIRVIYGASGFGPYSYTVERDITASNTTTLNLDLADTDTTINTVADVFSIDDTVQLADYDNSKVEIVTITSTATSVSGGYEYDIDRTLSPLDWTAGDGLKRISKNWVEGNAIVSMGGAVGEGYIELTSTTTLLSQYGPTISITSRTDADTWNGLTEVIALGNLRSRVDYTGDEYGMVIGNDTALTPTSGFKGITADATDGLRLFNVDFKSYYTTLQTVAISTSGSMKLGSNIASATTTSFDFTAASGILRIGNLGTNKPNLYFDGSDLHLRSGTDGTVPVITLANDGSSYFAGAMSIGTSGGIYQGTGTPSSPTTGLKIWNDSGIGRIAGYNSGTIQWYASTDGKLYAGAGAVKIDAAGITVTATNNKFTVDTSGNIKAGTNVSSATTTSLDFVASTGATRLGVLAASKANLYFDGTDLNMRVNTTNVAVIGSGGTFLAGSVTASKSNLYFDGTNLNLRSNTTNVAVLGGTGTMIIGRTGSNSPNLYFDGSNLNLRTNTTNVITLASDGSSSFAGPMTIGSSGGIYQGTGTFATPTTGLKIWNASGIGKIAGYNSGTAQWYADTDGKLYAGGGGMMVDATGLHVSNADTSEGIKLFTSDSMGDDTYRAGWLWTLNGEVHPLVYLYSGKSTSWGDAADNYGSLSLAASTGSSSISIVLNGGSGVIGITGDLDMNDNDIADIGSLVIGAASTSYPFEIVGSAGNLQVDANGAGLYFTRGSANYIWATTTSGYLLFGTNGGTVSAANAKMIINTGGEVGIGTTSTSYKLDVNGSAHASSFPTSSDARFKENLRPITGALSKLSALTAYNFTWTENYAAYDQFCDKDGTPIWQLGFLAQDVAEQFPEVITRWTHNGRDGMITKDAYSVDYARMVPLLAVAIGEARNEAQTETEILRQRVAELESVVERMKARLN